MMDNLLWTTEINMIDNLILGSVWISLGDQLQQEDQSRAVGLVIRATIWLRENQSHLRPHKRIAEGIVPVAVITDHPPTGDPPAA